MLSNNTNNVAETLMSVPEELSEAERDREYGNAVLDAYLAAMQREIQEIEALWQHQNQRYTAFRFGN